MSDRNRPASRLLVASTVLSLVGCSASAAYSPHPAADSDGSLGFSEGANVDVGAADVTITPTNPADGDWIEFAYGVDMPGDLDGDGVDDLLVYTSSLSGPDFAESIDGFVPSYDRLRVGIVYGGSDLFERGPRLDAAISTVWVWGGETAREVEADPFSRLRVVPAGDVDGDGAVDLLFSVRNGGCQQGNAYLVYGGARLEGEVDVRAVGVTLREEGECTGFGLASPLGDLDGDGYDDFVVAAPGRTPPADAPGRAYLYYGAPSRPAARRTEADADAVLDIDARWGGDVRALGDIDGDGADDVAFAVAAAPMPDELAFDLPRLVGRDYGGPSPHLSEHRVLLGGARLDGEHALASITTAFDFAATRVRGLPDLDADGRSEVAAVGVTDPTRSVLRPATVLSSPGAEMPRAAWSIDGGDARIAWIEPGGDVDGDGRLDLLIGVEAGALGDHVALLLGASGPFRGEVALSSAVHFLPRSLGENLDDELSGDAAGGSDLDGDGLDDLALVSSSARTGEDGRAEGQVLLFRGRR